MKCLRCGLINPSQTSRCDCGFDFETGEVRALAASPNGQTLATLGERFAGQTIDGFVAYGGLFLGTYITSHLGITSAPAVVLCLLYLLFADGIGNGQSVGKKLLGIAVVDRATGAPTGHLASFIRNVFMVFGALDWIFIFGGRHQRLGDKAAGTSVIKLRRAR